VLLKILKFSVSIGYTRQIFFIGIVVADQHVAMKYIASENVPPLLSPNISARGQEE
jgi:hypothetical protein